jgi:hypothetical protein
VGSAAVITLAVNRVWSDRTSAAAVTSAAPTTVVALTTTSTSTTLPPPTTSMTTTPPPQVPVSALLATPHGMIPTYSSPGAGQIGTEGVWYGYQLVLPVLDQAPGWVHVRLAQRPNGSTAWVHTADVTLSSTPYRIVVSLTTMHLTVYRSGFPILRFPAGIGVPATPTVTGNYFVAVHEAHVPAAYGPFVLDTSAHSDAIKSWDGMGDAIVAIHGPINSYADSRIGTTGVRISNGCIRLHDRDLAQLSIIPVGTPVDIVA